MEDFTGRGLADLREGIIRTPLPPTETFLDGELQTVSHTRRAGGAVCVGKRKKDRSHLGTKYRGALSPQEKKK